MNKLIICLFLMPFISQAQDTKEAVILYNSEPVKVELTQEGTIKTFFGLVPGYMAGYEVVKPILNANLPTLEDKDVNKSNYAILSKNRIELTFDNGFATLSNPSIQKLNLIAAHLNKNPQQGVLITSHYQNESDKNSLLNSNRLKSIQSYLGLKNIPESRIQVEIQQSDELKDQIMLNYLNWETSGDQ